MLYFARYFVDLQSAFSSTWRSNMWRRLHEADIRGKVYRLIRESLYIDTLTHY